MNYYNDDEKFNYLSLLCESLYELDKMFVFTESAIRDTISKKSHMNFDIDAEDEKKTFRIMNEIRESAMEELSFQLSNKDVLISGINNQGEFSYAFSDNFINEIKQSGIKALEKKYTDVELRLINMFILSSISQTLNNEKTN